MECTVRSMELCDLMDYINSKQQQHHNHGRGQPLRVLRICAMMLAWGINVNWPNGTGLASLGNLLLTT